MNFQSKTKFLIVDFPQQKTPQSKWRKPRRRSRRQGSTEEEEEQTNARCRVARKERREWRIEKYWGVAVCECYVFGLLTKKYPATLVQNNTKKHCIAKTAVQNMKLLTWYLRWYFGTFCTTHFVMICGQNVYIQTSISKIRKTLYWLIVLNVLAFWSGRVWKLDWHFLTLDFTYLIHIIDEWDCIPRL
jgi:hypothetical protein